MLGTLPCEIFCVFGSDSYDTQYDRIIIPQQTGFVNLFFKIVESKTKNRGVRGIKARGRETEKHNIAQFVPRLLIL